MIDGKLAMITPPEPYHKVRIKELREGRFEEVSVNQVRYYRLPWVSATRFRLMGVVINGFINESGDHARLEIHDGTASIQIRAWDEDVLKLRDPKTGELFEVGALLDVMGRIRSWRDEIYIYPHLVMRVEDPNALLLREAEILRRMLRISKPKAEDASDLEEVVLKLIKDLGPLTLDEILDLVKSSSSRIRRSLELLLKSGLIYVEDGKFSYRNMW